MAWREGAGGEGGWRGLVYFFGIDGNALGFMKIVVDGPFGLIGMMESLGGFMVLRWSTAPPSRAD